MWFFYWLVGWLVFYVTMESSACYEGPCDVLSGKKISLAVCDPLPASYIYKK